MRYARRSADRHLPRHASGRTADSGIRFEALFHSLFFDAERYDLSAVGRVKMNARLDLRRTISSAFCVRKTSWRS
jgi:hypothetical protein